MKNLFKVLGTGSLIISVFVGMSSYSRAASYTTKARIYVAELEGSNYWRAASDI